MVDRGMAGEVIGDKGGLAKSKDASTKGGEAMWAVTFIKELWKKGIWNDAKTVSIAVSACRHPVVKVQSAGIHFFLGVEDEEDEEESEDEGPDLMKLVRQRVVKKKTKGDDRRLARARVVAGKVRNCCYACLQWEKIDIRWGIIETQGEGFERRLQGQLPRLGFVA